MTLFLTNQKPRKKDLNSNLHSDCDSKDACLEVWANIGETFKEAETRRLVEVCWWGCCSGCYVVSYGVCYWVCYWELLWVWMWLLLMGVFVGVHVGIHKLGMYCGCGYFKWVANVGVGIFQWSKWLLWVNTYTYIYIVCMFIYIYLYMHTLIRRWINLMNIIYWQFNLSSSPVLGLFTSRDTSCDILCNISCMFI